MGKCSFFGNAGSQTFIAEFEVASYPANYANTMQTITYTYDVRNKLVRVSDNGSTEASYMYNVFGDRVSETTAGITTLYLTDSQNPTGYDQPVEEKTSATGKPVMTFILGDRVFAQMDGKGTLTYLLADGHGSTRLLASASGTITAAFNYDAFGNALNFNANLAATPFLFGGDAMYDAPSGLYVHGDGVRERMGFFFIERDYGAMGQGNTQDPLSLHKYLYVWGDPVNGNDPTGHMLGPLIAAAEGAAADAAAWTVSNGAMLVVNATLAASSMEALAEDGAIEQTEFTVEGESLTMSDEFDSMAANAQQIINSFIIHSTKASE